MAAVDARVSVIHANTLFINTRRYPVSVAVHRLSFARNANEVRIAPRARRAGLALRIFGGRFGRSAVGKGSRQRFRVAGRSLLPRAAGKYTMTMRTVAGSAPGKRSRSGLSLFILFRVVRCIHRRPPPFSLARFPYSFVDYSSASRYRAVQARCDPTSPFRARVFGNFH